MRSFISLLIVTGFSVWGMSDAMAESLASLRSIFDAPPREYASGPLWTWNDLLTEEQIVDTLEDLASQGVKQAFIHPRPGLMTSYLSEDWFRLWKKSLETAERLDMNIWIYDENSYPSGFAGGYVPEAMPESRGQGLEMESTPTPVWAEDVLGVYRVREDTLENVSGQVKEGGSLPEGDDVVVRRVLAGESPWYGGWWYVDLLRPGVTEKFLEVTMGAYEREIGAQFGKRMPGAFTDEPHLRPAGKYHWTPDLPEVFERQWGYDVLDHLPSLAQPVGEWQRVRHNYYQTLLDLFIDRWAKPYYTYCEEKGIEFTGHYWEHEWPNCTTVPDNMAMYAWHQRPAIDTLFNQYREDVHAQFGNTRAVLELASVANQLGKERTLCEAYGGAGWETRLEDMKRIGDWLYVLGVNTMDEHLSRVSMRGARKADYPPSFSYHSPWWSAYHVSANYFTRLSAALSAGEQINEILLLEPTTTAWMYQGEPAAPRKALGIAFQELVVKLAQDQVEYDIGCEDIIADHGRVEGAEFIVGERSYHTVVIPPLLENLNAATVELLAQYIENGGVVLSCAEAVPGYVDGVPSELVKALATAETWASVAVEALSGQLMERMSGITVQRQADDQGILYHHRRKFGDGQLLFLVNTSLDSPSRGTVLNAGRQVQVWNLETGDITAQPCDGDYVFELAPSGSLLLTLNEANAQDAPSPVFNVGAPLAAATPMTVRRAEPNVLVIDFLDLAVNGQTLENVYYHRASEFTFQQHGLAHNPWDHAVQFKDNLVSAAFEADSGFTASYHFTIAGEIPAGLEVVVERPDLYTITCNGQPVTATPDAWWFDKSFGRIPLDQAAVTGKNTLVMTAAPFTIFHEIAAVYILGDFALESSDSGFEIVAPRALTTESWKDQGMPLYGDAVIYTQQFDIAEPGAVYRVVLPSWDGSVAEVFVNGVSAGYIWHPPYQLDLNEGVQPGLNSVEVRVVGTPKNTMGPHHGNPAPGLAGPEHFRRAPESGPPAGTEYQTIAYGLFEPFQLVPLVEE